MLDHGHLAARAPSGLQELCVATFAGASSGEVGISARLREQANHRYPIRTLLAAVKRPLLFSASGPLPRVVMDWKRIFGRGEPVALHPAGQGRWTSGSAGCASGLRKFRLWVPASYDPRVPSPLVMMLHGCRQKSEELAETSGMNAVAPFFASLPASCASAPGLFASSTCSSVPSVYESPAQSLLGFVDGRA